MGKWGVEFGGVWGNGEWGLMAFGGNGEWTFGEMGNGVLGVFGENEEWGLRENGD